jgi:hypothetical protein
MSKLADKELPVPDTYISANEMVKCIKREKLFNYVDRIKFCCSILLSHEIKTIGAIGDDILETIENIEKEVFNHENRR